MVVDRYMRPLDTGENNSGEIIVEQLGYVSPQRQIEALMYAGAKLMQPDGKEYDYESLEACEADDGSIPVRDADLIDVGRMSAFLAEESQRRGSGSVTGVEEPTGVTQVENPEVKPE